MIKVTPKLTSHQPAKVVQKTPKTVSSLPYEEPLNDYLDKRAADLLDPSMRMEEARRKIQTALQSIKSYLK